MKRLYDETHEHGASDFRRTIWYLDDENKGAIGRIFGAPDEYGGRMITLGDYLELAQKLNELINADIQNASGQNLSETHWVFYSNIVDGDAIQDKVRFAILVRLKNSRYDSNINMSDYIFATSFDETIKIKDTIESHLNK